MSAVGQAEESDRGAGSSTTSGRWTTSETRLWIPTRFPSTRRPEGYRAVPPHQRGELVLANFREHGGLPDVYECAVAGYGSHRNAEIDGQLKYVELSAQSVTQSRRLSITVERLRFMDALFGTIQSYLELKISWADSHFAAHNANLKDVRERTQEHHPVL